MSIIQLVIIFILHIGLALERSVVGDNIMQSLAILDFHSKSRVTTCLGPVAESLLR